MTGRSEDFRLVHFSADTDARPGDCVDVTITEGSAHYLIGDSIDVTRTRGGDAHQARVAEAEITRATNLGMPTVRA
jgi:tRNA-2-methylthio-N6-dimethylallyladenosine synthase